MIYFFAEKDSFNRLAYVSRVKMFFVYQFIVYMSSLIEHSSGLTPTAR